MDATGHRDEVFLNKVTSIIDKNIDNEEFGVKLLCKELGVSRSKLHRKLNSLTGKSTSQFIREFRLERAREMLTKDVATAAEIAYSVGFKSPSYFSSSFHKYFGYPPGEVKFLDSSSLDKDLRITNRVREHQNFSANRIFLIILVCALLAIIGLSLGDTFDSSAKKDFKETDLVNNSPEKAIAILPFKMLSDEKLDEYFANGLMASVQNNLSKINGLIVISQRSVERFKDSVIAPSNIAKDLGIDYLLTGTIAKQNDSIRIIANLLNAKEDLLLVSMVFEEDYNHILSVQADIGTEISNILNISISPSDLTKINRIPTDNLDAYNLYLKGAMTSSTYSEGSQLRAIEYYNRSIELDDEFALPYAGLAESYRLLALNSSGDLNLKIKKIKSLASKSIETNDNSLAHIVLGALAISKECQWEEAEREYMLAIELNPNNPDAYLYFADYLLHVKKQFDESERQLKKAQILDPFNIHHKLFLAKYYFYKRDYDNAMIEFRNARLINVDFANTIDLGFLILVKQKRFDEAIVELEKLMRYNKVFEKKADEITPIYNAEGIDGIFRFLIEEKVYFETLVSNEHLSYALYYAYLGEEAKAIDLLRSMIDIKSHCVYVIPTNPYFDELHSEPEFIQLMKSIDLDGILDSDLKS